MQQVKWFRPDLLTNELAGSYTAEMGGVGYRLEVIPASNGLLQGQLVIDEETLLLSGRISRRSGFMSGFLLDSLSRNPIGVFRVSLERDGLLLQMDIPDFEELLERCDLEGIQFHRREA